MELIKNSFRDFINSDIEKSAGFNQSDWDLSFSYRDAKSNEVLAFISIEKPQRHSEICNLLDMYVKEIPQEEYDSIVLPPLVFSTEEEEISIENINPLLIKLYRDAMRQICNCCDENGKPMFYEVGYCRRLYSNYLFKMEKLGEFMDVGCIMPIRSHIKYLQRFHIESIIKDLQVEDPSKLAFFIDDDYVCNTLDDVIWEDNICRMIILFFKNENNCVIRKITIIDDKVDISSTLLSDYPLVISVEESKEGTRFLFDHLTDSSFLPIYSTRIVSVESFLEAYKYITDQWYNHS